ncbi:penicillin-binding protein 2 [soil metagenome]
MPLGEPARQGRPWPRFIVFALIIALVVTALGLRLFTLQIVSGGYYADLARENRIRLQPVRAPRGLIFDRTGRQLVDNVATFAVKARPADLPFSQRPAVIERLATLLGIPAEDITEALDRAATNRFELANVASGVPEEIALIIREEHLELPGVEVVVEPQREYPYGELVAHVLGFTGAVTPDELARLGSLGYLHDDTIGKQGVETTFEEVLRGEYGVEQIEVDARGEAVRLLRTLQPAEPGDSLELTIDVDIQRDAETALRWAMDLVGLEQGVVMVMNPQTGEILAMVSLPSYDNNLFSDGISTADYQALLNAPGAPLRNHAISDHIPPGSTYKLVTGVGGLADGVLTDRTKIRTRPFLSIGSYKYWDWNRLGFGPLDIYDGFGRSSDTFFFQVAGELGIDRLAYWGRQFGFGERTGVDLPGEVRGILPTNDWKMRLMNEPIYPGEVYQAGIGQGYNSFPPIQTLNAFAALANGGRLWKPQIVRRILGPDGEVVDEIEPELIRELPVDADVLRTMRQASRRVVTIRHTWNLVDLPIVIGAKTGTAEFGVRDAKGRLPYHSWFAGFVPKDPWKKRSDPDGVEAISRTDSELAILTFAYDSRTTGNAATEIAKYFFQLHYDLDEDLREDWILERDNFYGQ